MDRGRKLKGSIRFGAVSGGYGDGFVSVEIEDEVSGITFLELELSYEQFGRLVGSNGSVDCEFTPRGLGNIGKVREYEKASVTIPTSEYQKIIGRVPYDAQKTALASWLRDNHARDGWYMDTYLGSRGDIEGCHKTKTTTLRYGYYRYVDKSKDESNA